MPKARGLAHRARDLTLEELSRHFHLPINEVARELGLCVTVLKQRCREHGITRWPYRKVRKLDNLISALETNASSASLDGRAVTATPGELQICSSGDDEVMKKLDAVKETRNFLLMNPNSTAHLRIGKVKGPQSRSGKRSPADSGSPSPVTSSPSIAPPHFASRQFADHQQTHQQQQQLQEQEQLLQRVLTPCKKAPSAAASCMADTGSKPQAVSNAHVHSQQHTHPPPLLRWSEKESDRGRAAATPPAGSFADMEVQQQQKVGLSSWVVSGGLSSDPRQSAFRPLARQPSRTASSCSEADDSNNGVGMTLLAAAAAVAPLGASVRTGGLSSSMSSRESVEEEVGGGEGLDHKNMGPSLLRRVPSMDASSSGLMAGAGGGAASEVSAAVSACSSPSPHQQQREHVTAGSTMVHMHHPPTVARPIVAIPQQPFVCGAQFGMQWVPSTAVVYGGPPPMLLPPPGAPSPPMAAAYGLSPHFSPMGWYEFPMCFPWVTPTGSSDPRFAFPGDEGGWKSPMANPDLIPPHFGAYEQRLAGGGACAK